MNRSEPSPGKRTARRATRLTATLAALLLAAPATRAADAVQDVLKAMGIDAMPTEEVQAIQSRARELAAAGDHAGAAAQYKTLVDREPTRDNYRDWVRALESAGDNEKLAAAYQAFLAAHPSEAAACTEKLIALLERMRKPDDAIALLSVSVQDGAPHAACAVQHRETE